jgi:hypothetical protein
LIGINSVRSASFDAFKEMASLGRTGSIPKSRLGNSNAIHEEVHGFHEVVVVQEGFTHPHEHQIDAIVGRRYVLIAQNRTDLSNYFARA